MADLSFIIGIVGNVISVLMLAAPLNTFKRIIKNKSTEDFKALPYIITLLSTSLWTFYGLLKPGGLLVATVNGAGAILHIVYVTLFLIYAPKNVKIQTMTLVAIIDIAFLGAVIAITLLALHETIRLTMVGILCTALTIFMYAAPLSVMRTVIKTKSVEYMPFFLSFFQCLNGGVWAAYAVVVKDFYIGVPNGTGFILGCAQLILYFMYYKSTPTKSTDEKEMGSAHQVKGGIEMKNQNLHKGKSLPSPLTKTLSTSPPSFMDSLNEDIEKGLKDST